MNKKSIVKKAVGKHSGRGGIGSGTLKAISAAAKGVSGIGNITAGAMAIPAGFYGISPKLFNTGRGLVDKGKGQIKDAAGSALRGFKRLTQPVADAMERQGRAKDARYAEIRKKAEENEALYKMTR